MSLATAALILPSLVGKTARLVDLIALFANGVASGATLVAAVHFNKTKEMPATSKLDDQAS